MKRIAPFLVPLVLFLSVSAWAQGPLTPPGSPGETMKSLSQIEPRTPIESLPFTISTPGSYYLTGNLTSAGNGIVVTCDNATIDLMGFTLTGPDSDMGIYAQGGSGGIRGLVVRNGRIVGFNTGLYLQAVERSVFADLGVEDNNGNGVFLQAQSAPCDDNRFERCSIVKNGGSGILMSSYSVEASCDGNRIENCQLSQNTQHGLELDGSSSAQCNGNVIENVIAAGNGDSGIFLKGESGSCMGNVIRNCKVGGNVASGIKATVDSDKNRIEGNSSSANGKGLNIQGFNNYVADNMVSGNVTNYDFSATNQLNLLLSQLPQGIYWPANVKLAGTLIGTNQIASGIYVTADDVTIDLNGHALIGRASHPEGVLESYGIYSETRNLTVFNGTVSEWSMGGIYVLGQGARISRVTVVQNGNNGLQTGEGGIVTDCVALSNNYTGIRVGPGGLISKCTARFNDVGLEAEQGSAIRDCTASTNSVAGISAEGSLVRDCVAANNEMGIGLGSDCVVSGCLAEYNTGAGIQVSTGDNNLIDGNQSIHNQYGLQIGSSAQTNRIVRNTLWGNWDNHDVSSGNWDGFYVSSPQAAGAWDNFSN